jgi:hypothetical protein
MYPDRTTRLEAEDPSATIGSASSPPGTDVSPSSAKPDSAEEAPLTVLSLPEGILLLCTPLVVMQPTDQPMLRSCTEVLMQIIGYLDAKHVLQSVSRVNRAFHGLSNGTRSPAKRRK